MLKRFYPDMYLKSIFDIPYEKFKAENKTGLIFDIDNTLVPFDIPEPTEEITDLFTKLKNEGFDICLLSNNAKKRVVTFNNSLKLPALSKAKKPFGKGILEAIKLLGKDKENIVQIGDQVFTDIWCGNRLGLFTVLVEPVAERDEFTVRLKRDLEKKVISQYLKQVKINEN